MIVRTIVLIVLIEKHRALRTRDPQLEKRQKDHDDEGDDVLLSLLCAAEGGNVKRRRIDDVTNGRIDATRLHLRSCERTTDGRGQNHERVAIVRRVVTADDRGPQNPCR